MLVIGGYFVELHDKGLPVTSVLVSVVTGLVYRTELLLAPPADALSDGRGHKSFLTLVVGLLALSRLIEGLVYSSPER